MTKRKSNRGGKRTGAGRKPSNNPAQTISVYIPINIIEANGGKEEVKKIFYKSVGISK